MKMKKMLRVGRGAFENLYVFFSAIVIVPGRGILPSQGRVLPQGEPQTVFGLKLDLEFNGGIPKS